MFCAVMRHSSKSQFYQKRLENSVFYFSDRSISSGQKKNGHTAFENCAADLLLDDFHAVGVEFLLALFADGSLRS